MSLEGNKVFSMTTKNRKYSVLNKKKLIHGIGRHGPICLGTSMVVPYSTSTAAFGHNGPLYCGKNATGITNKWLGSLSSLYKFPH